MASTKRHTKNAPRRVRDHRQGKPGRPPQDRGWTRAFGDRLRAAILARYESPGAFGKAVRAKPNQPGQWCSGKVPAGPTLVRLSVHLGVSVDYLLGVPGSELEPGVPVPQSALTSAVRAHVIEFLLGTDAGAVANEVDRRRLERVVPSGRELLTLLASFGRERRGEWEDRVRAGLTARWVTRTLKDLRQREGGGDAAAGLARAYLAGAYSAARERGDPDVTLWIPWDHHPTVAEALLGRRAAAGIRRDGTPDEVSFAIPLPWDAGQTAEDREDAELLAARPPRLVLRHEVPNSRGAPSESSSATR